MAWTSLPRLGPVPEKGTVVALAARRVDVCVVNDRLTSTDAPS
ncbi:late competence protein required for DNA uptake (superfamily II DNA/RNA helicase) [Nocardiopsis mwathae]|uniref:Late competence protein required for DNA uptake (Superfamily II DNA/RNA helicase) n=1 Tax=Nocardiopsis mwathae TaxID=1472723 RepID=A0A7X0D499_9ACTN|nr:hypothetical protein [Nocardiopsis mwathae]MBB6171048.1 late competence protein required for DNA uptake (superfamily II DNA/RNA helicase) [Nocardiopsis mwathae]